MSSKASWASWTKSERASEGLGRGNAIFQSLNRSENKESAARKGGKEPDNPRFGLNLGGQTALQTWYGPWFNAGQTDLPDLRMGTSPFGSMFLEPAHLERACEVGLF